MLWKTNERSIIDGGNNKGYEMRLSNYVGNTPLIPIEVADVVVWCKAEFMNPGGSVKDRMVTYILNDAEANGKLKPGDTIVEATSGNTGIALAMLCAERKYTLYIIMPSNMSEERKKIFNYYGARLIETDPGDFDGAISKRDDMCTKLGFFNFNQFHNPRNMETMETVNTARRTYTRYRYRRNLNGLRKKVKRNMAKDKDSSNRASRKSSNVRRSCRITWYSGNRRWKQVPSRYGFRRRGSNNTYGNGQTKSSYASRGWVVRRNIFRRKRFGCPGMVIKK